MNPYLREKIYTMKKSITIKMFAFALLAILVTACSKYEEGSKFTLLTKKSRVVNTWKLDKVTSIVDATGTEADITSLFAATTVDLQKDGTAVVVQTVGSLSNTDTGTWAFTSDKTGLIFTDESGTASTSTIVKLKANELKLTSTDNGVTTIVEYVTN